jgi:hypothetical protein
LPHFTRRFCVSKDVRQNVTDHGPCDRDHGHGHDHPYDAPTAAGTSQDPERTRNAKQNTVIAISDDENGCEKADTTTERADLQLLALATLTIVGLLREQIAKRRCSDRYNQIEIRRIRARCDLRVATRRFAHRRRLLRRE